MLLSSNQWQIPAVSLHCDAGINHGLSRNSQRYIRRPFFTGGASSRAVDASAATMKQTSALTHRAVSQERHHQMPRSYLQLLCRERDFCAGWRATRPSVHELPAPQRMHLSEAWSSSMSVNCEEREIGEA